MVVNREEVWGSHAGDFHACIQAAQWAGRLFRQWSIPHTNMVVSKRSRCHGGLIRWTTAKNPEFIGQWQRIRICWTADDCKDGPGKWAGWGADWLFAKRISLWSLMITKSDPFYDLFCDQIHVINIQSTRVILLKMRDESRLITCDWNRLFRGSPWLWPMMMLWLLDTQYRYVGT